MTLINFKTVFWPKTVAEVHNALYSDGSLALVVTDYGTGEHLATATVFLNHDKPAEGHVFIKDYSENEGVLNCLIDQGIVSKPVREVQAGFVVVHECEVLV